MKLRYVKFSDERRKEFCIKTIIAGDNDNLKVYKKAIFDEGIKHIRDVAENASLLRKYYDTEVCRVVLDGDTAEFEYIEGESMEHRYIAAMKRGDIGEVKRLLLIHRDIILGNKENETVYSYDGKVNGVFGDCSMFDGQHALKCCNYDAIAGNIIFVNESPVFIDYEWVFEYPVPTDVVLYHCIHNFYEHYPEMEDLYAFDMAMEYIGVLSDIEALKKTYLSFYDYVTSDGDKEGFALMKAICLKNTQTVHDLKRENIVNMCECDRLQGVISDINGQLLNKMENEMRMDMQLEALKKANDEMGRKNYELECKVHELTEVANEALDALNKKTVYIIARKVYRGFRSIRRGICRRR